MSGRGLIISGMNEEDEKTGTLYRRWRAGQLANQSSASTIALSVVLVVTIVAAKAIVVSRSGPLIAQENAGKLLAKVAERGLDQILDRSRVEMTYLLEDNHKPIGYGVYQIEPGVGSEGQLIYSGKELLYLDAYLEYSTFTIANDLSHYTYQKRYRDSRTGALKIVQQDYREGLLVGQVRLGPSSSSLGPYRIDEAGFVAPFLIDLFSSLALQENFSKGVLFLRPTIAKHSGFGWKFQLEKHWVQASEEIDPDIVQEYPGGQGCTVEWLQTNEPQLAQKLYFNERHQLVWQQIPTERGELVYRAVSRQDILNHFPSALEILDRWRREPDEDDDHALL